MHIGTFRRVAVAVVSVIALSACAAVTGTGNPNVAATVNGEEIPISEVESQFEQAKKQPQIAQQLEQDPNAQSSLQAEILSRLVASRLLQDWADDLGITATDEEVAEEREALVEQLGGQEAFDQAVEQSGLTEPEVDEQIRQRVLQNEITAEVSGGSEEVTDEEVEKFYEENADARFGEKATARHILVEEKAKAQEIVSKLRKGADFAKLAKQESTDPGSAQQGGELPEFGHGQMVAEFDEAVFAADVGELVGPVKTEFGYHVIEVIDKQPGQELAEVEDEIRSELAQSQGGDLVNEELTKRTKEAEVTVNPRFGTWNPETGQVEPKKPLGETSEGGSEIPGAVPTDGLSEPVVVPTEAATQ